MTVSTRAAAPETAFRGRALVAVAVLLTGAGGLAFGVGTTSPPRMPDMPAEPDGIRFGIPVLRLIDNTAGVAAAGLALLLVLLPARSAARTEPLERVRAQAGLAVARTGLVWALATAATLWLQAAELSANGLEVSLADVNDYAVHITSGRALLVTLAAATGYAFAGPRLGLPLAAAGLIAVPLTGHASEDRYAALGMTAMGLHVAAAALWVGGLAAIFLLTGTRRELLATVLPRFSTLAGICIAAVATSGVIVAVNHLTMATGLTVSGFFHTLFGTGYGILVLCKAGCCTVLAGTGAALRFRLLPAIVRGERSALIGWVTAELAVMALAIGLATALARAPM